jgi:DNA-binding XRE family transcriptional regulator
LIEVAKSVGVTHPTIYRWECGQRRPTGDAAIRYAALIESIMDQCDG